MPDDKTTPFTVRPFQKTDADYNAVAAINTALIPDIPDDPDDIRQSDRFIKPTLLHGRLMAEQDGKTVAFCRYGQIPRNPDPGACFIYAAVDPNHQRRGIGGALYDEALSILKRRPLTAIRTHTREDFEGSMRFLEKHGYKTLLREPESYLDVQDFDRRSCDPGLKGIDRSGVRITTLVELQKTNPDWQKQCCDLEWDLVLDMPSAGPRTRFVLDDYIEVFDEDNFDPRAWIIAVDGDEWAAMSTVWSYTKTPGTFFTGITGVRRRYRRRGIALLMKLDIIDYVRAHDGRRIQTTNEENNPMLDINKRLGFVEGPAWLLLEKKL